MRISFPYRLRCLSIEMGCKHHPNAALVPRRDPQRFAARCSDPTKPQDNPLPRPRRLGPLGISCDSFDPRALKPTLDDHVEDVSRQSQRRHVM
jgi:hypothetical protein